MRVFCRSIVILAFLATSAFAQQVDLVITPAAAPTARLGIRFLPAEHELEEGNAAPVMLRMIWEQNPFMQDKLPMVDELEDVQASDPRIQEFPFSRFESELRRAAFMSDANWEYPLDNHAPAAILLPDMQGLRDFAGRGMRIWIKQRLAKNDVMGACEGVEIQLGCARHIGRTPFVVTHAVVMWLADMSLEQVESIVGLSECPNLYWSLAVLPNSLVDPTAAIQQESAFLRQSLPSLPNPLPPIGSKEWTQAAEEFGQWIDLVPSESPSTERKRVFARMAEHAAKQLTATNQFSSQELANMSEPERIVRWSLIDNDDRYARIECAFALPPTLAIAQLHVIETEMRKEEEVCGVSPTPFVVNAEAFYVGSLRFNRYVKILQTIEAIRDHAAENDGQLPQKLSDMRLAVGDDPLTGLPFEYASDGATATLSWDKYQPGPTSLVRTYKISVAK